jgi:hypothetical protein
LESGGGGSDGRLDCRICIGDFVYLGGGIFSGLYVYLGIGLARIALALPFMYHLEVFYTFFAFERCQAG